MSDLAKVPKQWEMVHHNYVLRGDGFYISYNPDSYGDHMAGALTGMVNVLAESIGLGALKDGEETALVRPDDNVFMILSGDFRQQYEQVFGGGYDACYKLFKSLQPEHGNNWSTDEDDR